MHDAWIAFVRDGSPDRTERPWAPFDRERRAVMEFGEEIGLREDPHPNSRALWEGLR